MARASYQKIDNIRIGDNAKSPTIVVKKKKKIKKPGVTSATIVRERERKPLIGLKFN